MALTRFCRAGQHVRCLPWVEGHLESHASGARRRYNLLIVSSLITAVVVPIYTPLYNPLLRSLDCSSNGKTTSYLGLAPRNEQKTLSVDPTIDGV